MSQAPPEEHLDTVSITPLLKRLADPKNGAAHIPAEDIALAWSRVFENRLSSTQLSALLTLLYVTGRDKHADVIARCASAMRYAATPVDEKRLSKILRQRSGPIRGRGSYHGGLCDLVGTGGDGHSTYNVSTTASIVVSPLLAVAKHGSRSQTSMSGSADLLKSIQPRAPVLEALTAENLPDLYEKSNYGFLLATNFHPGMRHAAQVRRDLGLRTIFNLMGPLANPADKCIEARVVGVAYQELGPVFTQALQLYGTKKAMVVCGQEDMDEISCAGPTNCWWIQEVPNPKYNPSSAASNNDATTTETSDQDDDEDVEPMTVGKPVEITLTPADFGLPTHPLSEVGGGKLPKENAAVLMRLLRNELPFDHPILHFVLLNAAALLVVSGICEADTSESGEVIKERGPGGGRWKEGVRLARWCIESGQALKQLEAFIDATNNMT